MKPRLKNSEEVEAAEVVLEYGTNMARNYLGCRWAWDVAPVF